MGCSSNVGSSLSLVVGRRDAAGYNVLQRIRMNLEDAWLTPLVARHNAGRGGLLVRAKLGADGGERWRFEAAEAV